MTKAFLHLILKEKEVTIQGLNRCRKDRHLRKDSHAGVCAPTQGDDGYEVEASKDAKKVYTECTAAVLRAKKCVMDTVTTVQENAEDIYAEAKDINAKREAEEEAAVYEDAAQTVE